ncbi:MAG: putative hemolysin secretion protein [Bacteroidetes bacterium]|nr:putative hemolysin secretion protein [Bacteroidota bacterium]
MSLPELKNIDIHSEPVREIMAQIPGWILRWGLTVIFGIVLLLILGSYLVKYPETISAPVIVTTVNSPAPLVCKASGKIDKLFVEEDQYVTPDFIVAVIENTADYNDYLELKQDLKTMGNEDNWENMVLETEKTKSLALGDMQNSFEQFKKNWNSFRNYLLQSYIPKKIKLIRSQVDKQKEYQGILLDQKAIADSDLELAVRKLRRDSMVYADGGYSITEFEAEKQRLYQKQTSLKNLEASIKNSELSILGLNQNIIELELQEEKEKSQYLLNLSESRQNLLTSIRAFEERYLIISPVEGKITLSSYWNENQVVNTGDRLATVIPEGEMLIIARAVIPPDRFGKIGTGQRVNIKLAGFPYMEFGVLTGNIKAISKVPDENGYLAEIELPKGMVTSYNKNLAFTQEMSGTADIVTKEMRLISRFIDPLKSMVRNN